MTVNELVSHALIDIGVVGQGQTAGGSTANFALGKLNRLIDSWKNNRLLVFTITRVTWTIASGTQTYTVGSGGTINIARPPTMNMQGSNVRFIDTSANANQEIDLWPLTDDAYQAIVNKAQAATYPTSWYYNPTYTSSAAPYGTLALWPVPDNANLTGVFYAPVAASTVALADTLALPPGYERFYETNLGLELTTSYPVSDTTYTRIAKQASDSKAELEKVNTRLSDLSVDLALVPQSTISNIYSGQVTP